MSLVTFYFIFPWYTYTFTLHLKEIIHQSTRRTYYYSELRWMMINLNKVKISFKRHHLSFCEPLWLFFFFLYTIVCVLHCSPVTFFLFPHQHCHFFLFLNIFIGYLIHLLYSFYSVICMKKITSCIVKKDGKLFHIVIIHNNCTFLFKAKGII